MKRIIFLIFTVLLISFQYSYSQEPPEGAIMLDENTIIKDESGNEVGMNDLMELLNSGEWTMDEVKDKEGNLLYMQLRKATEEEKKMMSEMPTSPTNDIIGESVPNFTMEDVNGNHISMETTKGKVIVLNFWFIACKPCIAEIPELNKVYEKYNNDTNVVFASITFDKKKKVDAFLKKHPIKYPIVSNANKICNLFKISGYPTNIVIDKNGSYYDYIDGGFSGIGDRISNSIKNALDEK